MLKVLTGEQLIKGSSVDIPKLVDPLLPKVGVASLAGSSDTGKSTMLQQLASAIVVGENNFLGFQLNATHNNVIYLSTEDDPAAVGARLIKQSEGNYEADQLVSLRFIFEYENLIDDLDKELLRQKADCVIIDAFADVFGDNDINQVSKVRSFINKFNELALKHQCLFLILHHIGKRTESLAPSKDSLIGSQGFEAKMRVVLFLQKDPKDSTLRHLSIVKGK
ncbi:AAA family ATPase [Spirosoma pollinicola]|uniref:AAA+ ATPase domain-containing protein n=1 Tax=Spirosoma pollinicola TaxID=2057025 RepID=A0A2K8Z906_9BACT|nr:AAA family ATPase [Spirosoma pollinicola]AUD06357.1 hypothetical protein CWM47_33660 [Spirosoma pollinicola]